MPRLFEILTPLFLSIIFTILWQNYQFHRANKYSYKLKLRVIRQLVRDSIVQCEVDIQGLNKFIEDTKANNVILPPLSNNPYKAIEQLSQRVINDEYFNAFSLVLRKVVDAEKQFFLLRFLAQSLHKRTIQIVELVDFYRKKDLELRQVFVENIRLLKDEVTPFWENLNVPIVIRESALRIVKNYLKQRKRQDDLQDMCSLLLQPLLDLNKNNSKIFDEEGNYSKTILKAHLSYENMTYQNSQFCDILVQLVMPYERELARLKQFEKYFIQSHILPLYSE